MKKLKPRQPKLTRKQVMHIIRNVQFLDRKFHLQSKGSGWLLQLSYMEADIHTGKPELQKSRKHYISPYMTETEIVDTCFLCVMRSCEHVVREHFMYKNCLVQSPHFSVTARIEMCDRNLFDGRIPKPERKPGRRPRKKSTSLAA